MVRLMRCALALSCCPITPFLLKSLDTIQLKIHETIQMFTVKVFFSSFSISKWTISQIFHQTHERIFLGWNVDVAIFSGDSFEETHCLLCLGLPERIHFSSPTIKWSKNASVLWRWSNKLHVVNRLALFSLDRFV